ncbi:hypothetical protein EM6_3037 [Asticcacaulis excentricus]|uniref:Uncharacterized protein n=1 Tax=Asticcacaulis excentricus TaxID=78587 RepID=A0A3G9G500_9CAUL|nr:hypothetical protein EM6_3037 [Asticcacaulis excentricus]
MGGGGGCRAHGRAFSGFRCACHAIAGQKRRFRYPRRMLNKRGISGGLK